MTMKSVDMVFCDYCPNTRLLARRGKCASGLRGWIARRPGGGEPLLDICPECQEREQEREND